MKQRKVAFAVLLALGLTMFCAGGAQAATTVTWGRWTVYHQEKSNWCWVAASKAIIKKATGKTVSQCQIYKDGKGVSTCTGNQGGTKKNYSLALYSNGVTASVYTSGYPTWDSIRQDTLVGKGKIQGVNWKGTSTYHAAPIIGSKAATNQIYIVNIGESSVSASWITYSQFVAGTAGLGARYVPNNGWVQH